MKSKRIFSILAALVAACAFVGVYVRFVSSFGGDNGGAFLFAALFAVIGCVCFYVLHNLLHELFHALFALAFGGRITETSFCGFTFKSSAPVVSFAYSSLYGGWTSFYCKDFRTAERTLVASLVGGLVGTLFCLIIALFGGFLIKNAYVSLMMKEGSVVAFYMLAINFLPLKEDCDGTLLFLRGESFVAAAGRLEFESKLYAGSSAGEAYPLFVEEKYGRSISFVGSALAWLEEGNAEKAEETLNALLETVDGAEKVVVEREAFFVACLNGDGKSAERLLSLVDFDGADPSSVRVHAAYRLYTGEKEWAKTIASSFGRALQREKIKGLAKTESAIFESLLKNRL